MISQPKVLLLGAASVAIYPLAFYTSMRLSGVAIGTVVSIATAPFFAAILESLISKKYITGMGTEFCYWSYRYYFINVR
ncbi:hypothetical protein P4S81_20740 [Pseudoalteromonas sp. B28]